MSDFLELHDDSVARRVLYAVAVLLLVIPFVQAGAQIWPLQLGNIQWRFGAASALSSVLLLPFLGLALLLLMARGLGRRALAMVVGAIGGLFTLGLLASLAVFVMDAQELRTIVSTRMSGQFTNTTLRVMTVTGLFLLGFALLTVCGFVPLSGGNRGSSTGVGRPGSSRRTGAAPADDSDRASTLIVGR